MQVHDAARRTDAGRAPRGVAVQRKSAPRVAEAQSSAESSGERRKQQARPAVWHGLVRVPACSARAGGATR